jgi:MFS family permease
MNPRRLYLASCLALIATAMSFAIRGDIMGEVQGQLNLTDVQVGWILGAAFWGFGLSILFGGPLCDLLGMGTIMRLAAVGHIAGALLTVMSTNFTVFFVSTVVVGIANGFVEAAINPLVATIYAENKTARLTTLHAWFPGGIVIGGVLAFLFTQLGLGWVAKTLLLLVPSVIYFLMFMGQQFPATERAAAGVPFGHMFKELLRPLFIVLWCCMILTAATELGANSWIPTIFNRVTQSELQAGILQVVWINMVMYLMRQFGHGVSHRVAPTALIAVTAVVAAIGLYMFSHATTAASAFLWAAVFAMGIAFWWPTMLGITSERFPRSGALGLAVIGATGSFATAISGPVMGWLSERYGTDQVLPIWSALPVVLIVIFGAIYLADRARGGYRIERIGGGGA